MMGAVARTPPEERIFIQNGRRHYRKSYSITEVRIGAAVVLGLIAVAAWVMHRGRFPDPELFATVIPTGKSAGPADRGPLPEGLTLDGWNERGLSKFDSSTLYEKINGREGFYKAFGFQFLYFASLQNDADPEVAVDIELYDLGKPENAIGAFAGEMPEDVDVTANARGLSYRTPNALFMVRGENYLRALGSSIEPPIQAALDRVSEQFDGAVEGAALPWAFALFVGELGAGVSDVAYEPENAFSFGFATQVFTARRTGDTQIFVRRTEDPTAADALARRFEEGFAGMGEPVRGPGGVRLAKDRFLGGLSTVATVGPLVVGVHGAPDIPTAIAELEALRGAAAHVELTEAPAPAGDPPAETATGERSTEGEREAESAYEETY